MTDSDQPLQTAGRKRKNSSDEVDGGSGFKHRSSQACQSCRTRKVRCDVTTNGARCTNCRLDSMQCIVLASRRGKNNHNSRNKGAKAASPVSAQVMTDSGPGPRRTASFLNAEANSTPETSNGINVPACVTFDDESDNVESDITATTDLQINGTDHQPSEVYGDLLTPETSSRTASMHQHAQSTSVEVSLPPFIVPLPSGILNDDLEFLSRKGALTLPPAELRLEIVRAYMASVHPFMPLLDSEAFVRSVVGDGGAERQISLLLFQAVMFAGLHSLPLHLVNLLGFETTKQAREVFFTRVRLLYEFDVEADSTAVYQSLVLMSSWYSKADARRHTWHWTGLAYDLARRMGLHREPAGRNDSIEVRRFRRRLWWSLYIRDRMIALGVRSPMRIYDEDFDVAMLTLDDFDIGQQTRPERGDDIHGLLPSLDERRSTALMCIQLAKLGVCIGHVVNSQYTTLSTQADIPHTTMVVSRRDSSTTKELARCEDELDTWFNSLPTSIQMPGSSGADGLHDCSEVHWAMLNMAYLTAINVLHRAQALQPMPEGTEAQKVHRSSRTKVKSAARGLTKIAQNLLVNDQVRSLSLIGVTALIAASLSHMLDVRSEDEDVRDASTFRLHQTLEVLQTLRGIYGSADAAVSFLASVTRKAGISVPACMTSPSRRFSSTSRDRIASITTGVSPTMGSKVDQLVVQQQSWQTNPLHMLSQAAEHLPDPQQSLVHGLMNNDIKLSSMDLAGSSQTPSNGNIRLPSGFSTPALDGFSSDWNSGIASGMDLEPLSFNYDFYTDAFGFLDSQLSGI